MWVTDKTVSSLRTMMAGVLTTERLQEVERLLEAHVFERMPFSSRNYPYREVWSAAAMLPRQPCS
ncbi:hypothetical protein, partial [Chloroflexus sp.]|uniref:hypothetical protein n=1 Tax=Chloroflexus sp. TaxID=1904827 RepID=UPI004049F766